MLIDPPENTIDEELEDFDLDIDYNSLDSFFQPSEDELDIATEDAIALTEFLKEYGN